MLRFLLGIGCGAVLMYWYLMGELPWSEDSFRWLSNEASSYSSRLRE